MHKSFLTEYFALRFRESIRVICSVWHCSPFYSFPYKPEAVNLSDLSNVLHFTLSDVRPASSNTTEIATSQLYILLTVELI